MQVDPTLEPRVRSAVRGVVGPSFSDDELRALEERALNAAEAPDAKALGSLQPVVPCRSLRVRRQLSMDCLAAWGVMIWGSERAMHSERP